MGSSGIGKLNSSYVTNSAANGLPYAMTLGSISVSGRVDQPPSGTVLYRSLTKTRLEQAMDAWGIDRQGVNLANSEGEEGTVQTTIVTLHGTKLALESASYTRSKYNIQGDYTELYDLTLTLGQANYIETEKNPTVLDDAQDLAARVGYVLFDKGVLEVLPIGAGRKWTFSGLNVDSVSKNRNLVSHEDTEIVFQRRPIAENNYLIEPKLFVYWEGDVCPDRPPGVSKLIYDLSNLFDQGGVRKDSRKVEKLDGTIVKETIESWGFLYYIADSDNALGYNDRLYSPTEGGLNLDPWKDIPPLPDPNEEQEDSELDPTKVNVYRSGGIVERTTPPKYWTESDTGGVEQPRIWVTVGLKEINYVYEELKDVELTVDIVIPNVSAPGAFVIDPRYKQFVEKVTPGSPRITLKTRAKYLKAVEESGWEYRRPEAERMDGTNLYNTAWENSDFRNPEFYTDNPLIYRKLPYRKRTVYELASTRYHYDTIGISQSLEKQKVAPPFSIAFQPYVDLDIETKAEFFRMSGLNSESTIEEVRRFLTPDLRVAVITPNPNYVEPMFPIRERTHESSLYQILNTILRTDVPSNPFEFHSTGSESIINVVRTPITGSQKIVNGLATYNNDGKPSLWYGYSEYTSENHADGSDYSDARVQSVSIRDVDGLPPEAQVFMQNYITSAEDPNGFEFETNRLRYYLTTTDNTTTAQTGQTFPVDAATIEEATPLIELYLKKDIAEKIQAQVSLVWHYPTIMPGDIVRIDSQFGSDWIVIDRSWDETYSGNNTPIGQLVTTSGTKLTLGLLGEREYTIVQSQNKFTTEVDPFVKITLTESPGTIEEVLTTDILGRRNPGL